MHDPHSRWPDGEVRLKLRVPTLRHRAEVDARLSALELVAAKNGDAMAHELLEELRALLEDQEIASRSYTDPNPTRAHQVARREAPESLGSRAALDGFSPHRAPNAPACDAPATPWDVRLRARVRVVVVRRLRAMRAVVERHQISVNILIWTAGLVALVIGLFVNPIRVLGFGVGWAVAEVAIRERRERREIRMLDR